MLPTLWLLPLVAALAGPTPPPRTTFRGHLDHAPAGDTVRLFVGNKRVKTPLSASGDFEFAFPDLAATTPVHFEYARQNTRLYLMPGDQLVMHLDFNDFDKSVTYSGPGADVNNYLAQAQYKFEYGPPGAVPRPLDQLRQQPGTTPAEMRRRADAFRQQQLAFLATYAQAHPLPASFRHDAEFLINMQWGRQLLEYVAHQRQQKPEEVSPPPPLSEAYFSFIKELPLRELDQHFRGLDENTVVAWFLNAYQSRLAPSGKLGTGPDAGPRLYRVATQELGETKARDMLLQMLLFNNIQDDLPGALAFYPTFRAHNRDSTLARNARLALAQRRQLSAGQPAPAFTLVNDAGQQVSLSDFKGQVIYLDFWGTWCEPCMREMKEFAPALKKKFEGRDVVFLYVAVDQNQAKWQQTLTEQHFTSANAVHLYERDGQVAGNYQVNGYPSYYLIGRDGRFVQLWTSRPSDGDQTVAAIEAALKQQGP